MRDQVLAALKSSIIEVFPEFVTQELCLEKSLQNIGANSIDRAEIIMLTMERLKLKKPMLDFAQAKNIGELVDIFFRHTIGT